MLPEADGSLWLKGLPREGPSLPGTTRGAWIRQPGYASVVLDPWAGSRATSEVVIRLVRGATLAGTVRDATGSPRAKAGVCLESLAQRGVHLEAQTDEAGAWRIADVPKGPAILRAWEDGSRARLDLEVLEDATDLRLRLLPFVLPPLPKAVNVAGVSVVDVTPELRAALGLDDGFGVLQVVEGTLGTPRIAIYTVEGIRVGSVRAMVDALLEEVRAQGPGTTAEVVGLTANDLGRGYATLTWWIHLTEAVVEDLRALRRRL
jgi:hypothetical protein